MIMRPNELCRFLQTTTATRTSVFVRRQRQQQQQRVVSHPHVLSISSRTIDTDAATSIDQPSSSSCVVISSRRKLLQHCSTAVPSLLALFSSLTQPALAADIDVASTIKRTDEAQVTDRIFFTIQGLSPSPSATATSPPQPQRIVIGLFGKDAPYCTQQFKQLVSAQGLPAPCRPRAERTLQKEQLEANKVYKNCLEGQAQGVSLRYSTIWRIVPNERIDVGAVTGKFVAREYPTWQETNLSPALTHDAPGVISVRRGNDGGFGFTIYPGDGSSSSSSSRSAGKDELDRDHIVIGRVLEGMDVVEQLNRVPVMASSKVNYMALTGGTTTKNAPSRACRYGGPMYCNENKPLVKLTLVDAGIL